MDVHLSSDLEALIGAKVASGRYHSADEVLQDALRLLDERDRLDEAKLADLRLEIRRGLDQLDRGESAPLDIEAIKMKARMQRQARR